MPSLSSIPVENKKKLLKPTFNTNNFEESFMEWEFELSKYERDNNAKLSEQVKIVVLLSEATGPLQQHLQLLAGSIKRYPQARNITMEYNRVTTTFSRMERQQQTQSSAVTTSFVGGQAVGAIGKEKGRQRKRQRTA